MGGVGGCWGSAGNLQIFQKKKNGVELAGFTYEAASAEEGEEEGK